MKAIISPESIKILSASPKSSNKTHEDSGFESKSKSKSKESFWSTFKSKVKDVWDTFKPIVEKITSFLTAAVTIVNTFDTFVQHIKPHKVKRAVA